MTASQLLAQLSDLGVRLWEEKGKIHFQAPSGTISGKLREELSQSKNEIIALLKRTGTPGMTGEAPLVVDEEKRYEPFVLTDIQSAYLIGRDESFELGNVACHAYYELDSQAGELNIGQLESALNRIIKRHEALRLVFFENGTQKILESVPRYKMPLYDFRALPEERAHKERERLRKELSHKIHDPGTWPLFEVGAVFIDRKVCLYISFDLLLADFYSAFLLFRDLVKFYENPGCDLLPVACSVRDYVIAEQSMNNSPSYVSSREYWLNRADTFPLAPQLPQAVAPGTIVNPRFKRRQATLSPELWQRIKTRAVDAQITTSTALMAAYAAVIARWSKDYRFCVNLTLSNRRPVHPQVMEIAGDFTTVSLLEVTVRSEESFEACARVIQQQVWDDMDHRHFSGVRFIRELARLRGQEGMAMVPVVFSSSIGAGQGALNDFDVSALGTLTYGITQTPQVSFDHQVVEHDGALFYVWDVVEELYPKGLVDEMFDAYRKMLFFLAEDPEAWDRPAGDLMTVMPPEHAVVGQRIMTEPSGEMLHTLFERQAAKTPEKEAVVSGDVRLSYAQLDEIADAVGRSLFEHGARPNTLVALVMEKGWEQVSGALGVLKAGAAYMPVDPAVPPERLTELLKDGQVSQVLTQSRFQKVLSWPEGVRVFSVDTMDISGEGPPLPRRIQAIEDLAYVIYTSGSTGRPKGVMIDHLGAVNTICDVNRRFSVTGDDRLLSLAALHFDLSVYDLFGPLAAGATIILPDPKGVGDPAHWLNLLKAEKITLWNSVPQLMQMLDVHASDISGELSEFLRLVLLSGDWIPLELPRAVFRRFPNAELHSLGGATEASIWSICCPVTTVEPHWKSIPYGMSMERQSVCVLNRSLEHCPAWVIGDLYIGGIGLAKGYWNDPEKSRASFVEHPVSGQRLYRTGDLGRYLPDGNIEFLGREDNQVKVSGYRIELGEIESALRQHLGVSDSVVVATDDGSGNKKLSAYVVARKGKDLLFETEKADPEKIDEIWRAVIGAGDGKAAQGPDEPDRYERFSDFWKRAENACVQCICMTLKELGIFTGCGERHTPDKIVQECGLLPRYGKLLAQWLELLEAEGILGRDDGAYVSESPIPDADRLSIWQELENRFDTDEQARILCGYFKNSCEQHLGMLKGKAEPLELFFPEGGWQIAESLYQHNAVIGHCNTIAAAAMAALVHRSAPDQTFRVIEVGAGIGGTTASLLKVLSPDRSEYLHTDLTGFFEPSAREKFSAYPFVDYGTLNIDLPVARQGYDEHSFDVVVAVNVLHDARHIAVTLSHMISLLKPGGALLLLETTRVSPVQLAAMGFLEGLNRFEDHRTRPLMRVDEWRRILEDSGLGNLAVWPGPDDSENTGQHVIMAQGPLIVRKFAPSEIRSHLEKKLPDYMIPQNCLLLDELPLTPNGKVDRASLPAGKTLGSRVSSDHARPSEPAEKMIAGIWEEVLSTGRIGSRDNFFDLGGDSLSGVQITALIRQKAGVEISLRTLFRYPVLSDLANEVRLLMKNGEVKDRKACLPQVTPETDGHSRPFPLTDIQHAYVMGRSGIYELGGVAAHCYFELDSDGLDPDRAEQALRQLIEHHGMLRVVFLEDEGKQMVLDQVPPYEIMRYNLCGVAPDESQARLQAVRQEMSHQIINTSAWPLFDIRASVMEAGRVRLHISFDNAVLDAWSMFHLLSQWSRLTENPSEGLPVVGLTFKDYVRALEEVRETELYATDRTYWMDRLSDLPPAPDLPMVIRPDLDRGYRFQRLEQRLDPGTWARLRQAAQKLELTPSGLLLAVYSEVLGRWCRNSRFTINLTLFNRFPFHEGVEALVGDFTSMTLLAVDSDSAQTFAGRARALQQQLLQDMDHPHFSGVHVLRELTRHKKKRVIMPIVFTSALGLDQAEAIDSSALGRFSYTISQTPQVLLDFQVYEASGQLSLVWDAVWELFPDGFLKEMFTSCCDLLRRLAENQELWDAPCVADLPSEQTKRRSEYNATKNDLPTELLHSLFSKSAAKHPEKEAVVTSDKRMSYGELEGRAHAIARRLIKEGVAPGSPVAVVMEKGWEQVAGALGVLNASAAYMPLDASMPFKRLESILEKAGVCSVLTQSRLGWGEKLSHRFHVLYVDTVDVEPERQANPARKASPGDLAYIIYTSGSTGEPKGVMIDHKGAVNTLLDINRRFHVGPDDKVLALSALHFDLSVYDIFGTLAAGGTIVIPRQEMNRNPGHWADWVAGQGVTIWNSVPQLMQMMVEHAGGGQECNLSSLRLVLLSGDWIPPALPEKIARKAPEADVISLGGATEASVWSIFYPATGADSGRMSIPYGFPMANQTMHVLDKRMRPCPDRVVGEIYIGGAGLALGYWKDPEKTAFSFITHPETGETLYRTGDLGRFAPEGWIEFMGREDFQVKINGYRVELGEIESACAKHPDVREAVAHVADVFKREKRLLLYAVSKEGAAISEPDLKEFLRQWLPEYMVPFRIVFLDALPVTDNGKIDRKGLPLPQVSEGGKKSHKAPGTDTELFIARIIEDVSGIGRAGTKESFFDLGIDSVQLVSINNRLNEKLGRKLTVVDLFEHPNISSLAEYLDSESVNDTFQIQAGQRASRRRQLRKRPSGRIKNQDVA